MPPPNLKRLRDAPPAFMLPHNVHNGRGNGVIPERLRQERKVSQDMKKLVIFEQQYHCMRCVEMDVVKWIEPSWEVDHLQPLWLGGTNARDNLVALCGTCHNQKTQRERVLKFELEEVKNMFRKMTPNERHAYGGIPAVKVSDRADTRTEKDYSLVTLSCHLLPPADTIPLF